MTALWTLLGLATLSLAGLSALLAVSSLLRLRRLQDEVVALQVSLRTLENRVSILHRRSGERDAPSAVAPPIETPVATAVEPQVEPPPAIRPTLVSDTPLPIPAGAPAVLESVERAAAAAALPPPPTASFSPARSDFVSSLGPKILVSTGALAFVVFLGLFVKYAWENDWVGPWGRVLSGATLSLILLGSGLRLLGREYRPLGQGLAAMGLAGLYLSGYGAHAFYELIPRGLAGLLMVIVTVSAVTLAVRLDTRLLATLAWLGAYLTPLLLSTGEDRALSLYAYLLFLAVGALAVDGLKAWGETAPLAFAGTVLLYGGWYGQHYRAERFEVAALGVALFTAVFGLALARQRRPLLTAFVGLNAAFWITTMGADHGRPEWLLAMSLALACAWAWQSRRLGLFVGLVGLAASTFPYLAWLGTHQPLDPDRLGFATLWLVGGVGVFLWPDAEDTRLGAILSTLALGFSGFAAIGLAATVDRPLGLLALLLALTGLAIVLRPRFSGAELIGALSSALAVAAWIERFYRPERSADALLLALSVGLTYLLALGARVLLGATPLGIPGLATHVVAAALLFVSLHQVFGLDAPGVLASLLLALSAVYCVLGVASLRVRSEDGLARGTAFGLAIAFLTLAIPVWLGLHAITLAWAIEGAMLLGLGARYGSRGVRRAGHAVVGLAVIRLLVCHLPLHSGHFVSILNASFGTWLFVIAMLASGIWLTRTVGPEDGLESWFRSLMAATAIVLLFVALTTETQDTFAQWARGAELSGHFEAARFTRRAAGLGLSVLWTLFATGLLAGGLAARSRALYYAGYALFGFTALKVVFVDLATFPTLLRMFSFLALAVLLTAGAYLNLRFRARLAPVEDAR